MRLPASILRELAQALDRPQIATALAGAGGGAVAGGAYGIADEGAPGGPLGSAALGAGIGAAGLPYLLRNHMDDVARSLSQAGASPREALDGLSAENLRGLLGRPSLPPRGPEGRWPHLRGNLMQRISHERQRSNIYDAELRPRVEDIIDRPERVGRAMGGFDHDDLYLLAGGTGDARAVRSMLGLPEKSVRERIVDVMEAAARDRRLVLNDEIAATVGVSQGAVRAHIDQIRKGTRTPLAERFRAADEALQAMRAARQAEMAAARPPVAAVQDLARQGHSATEVAHILGAKREDVLYVGRTNNIKFTGKPGIKLGAGVSHDTHKQWALENDAGDSFEAIAAKYNVTRGAVAGGVRRARAALGLGPAPERARKAPLSQLVNRRQAVQTGTETETELERSIPTDPHDRAGINAMVQRWRDAGVELSHGHAQLIALRRAGASRNAMIEATRYSDPAGTLAQIRHRVREAGLNAERLVSMGPRSAAPAGPITLPKDLSALDPMNAEHYSPLVGSHPWINSPQRARLLIANAAKEASGRFKYSDEQIVRMLDGYYDYGSLAPTLSKARAAGIDTPKRGFARTDPSYPQGGRKLNRLLQIMEAAAKQNEVLSVATLATRLHSSRSSVRTMLTQLRGAERDSISPDLTRRMRALDEKLDRLRGRTTHRKSREDLLLALLGLSAAGGGLANVNSEDVRRAILGRLEERI